MDSIRKVQVRLTLTLTLTLTLSLVQVRRTVDALLMPCAAMLSSVLGRERAARLLVRFRVRVRG